MKKTLLFLLAVSYQLVTGSFPVYAQNINQNSKDTAIQTKANQWVQQSAESLRFEENKGQLSDIDGKPDNDLLFRARAGGLYIYITTGGLSYVFTNKTHMARKRKTLDALMGAPGAIDRNDSVIINYSRSDMELVGADIRKENVVKEDESPDRKDYYLGDLVVLNVHTYKQITIKNIYPGIDWVLYTANASKAAEKTGGMQYDFVVHPGGDPSVIKFRSKYANKPELQSDGSLKINTSMGSIVQSMPVSYMYDDLSGTDLRIGQNVTPSPLGEGRDEVAPNTQYTIKDNEISFKVDSSYDKNKTLIIDPSTEVWGTYAGSCDVFCLWDDGSNVFVGGGGADQGFPTKTPGGSYSGSGNSDIYEFIAATGAQEWATEYGGTGGNDYARGISSDGSNVWVTGNTGTASFHTKTLAGAYNQTTFEGTIDDPYIIKFNTQGVLEWATLFDGPNTTGDFGYSISSDGTNVWVTGQTSSTAFPIKTVAGAYNQSTPGGSGNLNAFIAEFKASTCAQVYCTIHGGTGVLGEAGYGIMTDGTHAWVTGMTSNLPTQTLAEAYNSAAAGGAFILEFNNSNSALVWGSILGSGSSSDIGYSINSDGTDVWVTGKGGGAPVLTPSGAYNDALAGTGFVSEFAAATSAEVWSTPIGGGTSDEGWSIVSDVKSGGTNVWLTGYTGSTNFPMLNTSTCTGSYFESTYEGSGEQNIFIEQFTAATDAMVWSTYFGDDGDGTGDGDGVYIASNGTDMFESGDVQNLAAASSSNNMPLVDLAGSYYNTTHTDDDEWLFIAKFSICNVVTPITLLYFNCAPASNGNGFDLTWATGTETNNKSFTIERSSDGINFYPITTVPGAGNSVFTKTYEYTDLNPLSGMNYYRLSQTDDFGNTMQDNVSACDEEDSVLVYPNPASGVFAIKLPTKDVSSPTTIDLYDLLGQRILSQTVQNQPIINISIPTVAASIYLVRITTAEKTYTIKLVIKK